MEYLRKPLLAAAFVLPFCASAAQAQGITLTSDQMVLAARQALLQGQPGVALPLTQAYLRVNPNSVLMLVLQSRAERDLGQTKAARATAKRAWSLAENDGQKFTVAMIAAQAASSDGNRVAGQFWLRRASNHATTPAQKTQLRRDFNYVRARNPWRLHLDFGLTPSSNINDGSSEDGIPGLFFGKPGVLVFSPDAKALSGLEGHVGVNLAYRLSETPSTRNWVGMQLFHKEVWLSDSAKEAAPDVSGSDFRYSSATLTYRHQKLLGSKRGLLDLNLRLGRNWYGGDPLSVLFGLGARFHFPAKNSKRLSLNLQYDLQAPDSEDVANIHTAQIGLRYQMPWKYNRLTLSGDLQKAFSSDATREYDEVRLGANLDLAKKFIGTSLSVGVTASYRDYAEFNLSSDGRRDKSLGLNADLTFGGVSYWGFAPVLRVEHSRTSSSLARYTKTETSVGLAIRSQF